MWFAFPSISSLANATEEELRELGFGYRAKSIIVAAQQLQQSVERFKNDATLSVPKSSTSSATSATCSAVQEEEGGEMTVSVDENGEKIDNVLQCIKNNGSSTPLKKDNVNLSIGIYTNFKTEVKSEISEECAILPPKSDEIGTNGIGTTGIGIIVKSDSLAASAELNNRPERSLQPDDFQRYFDHLSQLPRTECQQELMKLRYASNTCVPNTCPNIRCEYSEHF